jgi:glyoxylase-like metal-dependent hydrolase (beta-lactamase superfamily II)
MFASNGKQKMEITSFYESDSGTWTYLLADPVECVAAIIDPVWVFDPVSGLADTSFVQQALDRAAEAGYRIAWVLETHAHADHLSAAGWIREHSGAGIACGRGICDVQKTFARVFNMKDLRSDGSVFDRLLEGGDEIELGQLTIRVMDTPGHTGDSVTYVVENAAFIGDTLFSPAFGTARCDFPGGDAGHLYDSIQALYELPGDTRLFLCHDYPKAGQEPVRDITVEESRRSNIHLSAETTRDEFIAMRTGRDSQLGLPRLILPSLQVNILGGEAPEADDNGVSYLRIPFNRSIADLIKGD